EKHEPINLTRKNPECPQSQIHNYHHKRHAQILTPTLPEDNQGEVCGHFTDRDIRYLFILFLSFA
ncbi:hypothetical protein, partial [Klebsiella pneumoniae]|uniref:hypothetical protein n=1 Tax=Klebsiella pneumoniae TaxID=573 RepID=UPI0027313054